MVEGHPPLGSLAVSALSRSFGGLRAVAELTFSVVPGGVTALIGPNGAGKSTTFDLVTGLLRPTAGRVEFDDHDITGFSPHRIAALGISRTFQNLQLFSEMTVLENVLVGLHTRLRASVVTSGLRLPFVRSEERSAQERAREHLARVDLLDDEHRPARSLPFGRQRLLELARALVSEPRLLLLDEPAAGLNTAETLRFADLIRTICASGTTVLLVEHNMRLVMDVSDRVVVLNHGRRIFEGLPAAAQTNPTVIEAYLGRGRDVRAA